MPRTSDIGKVLDAEPVMVSGVYRSGTTFITAMLGAHSSLNASSSTIKFLRFCLQKFGDLSNPSNVKQLITDTHKRVQTRWNLSLDEEAIFNKASQSGTITYALLYDLMMRSMLIEDSSSGRWVEKLAAQWEDIPIFLEMFPKGKVIHIYRDPRDVTASYKAMTFEPQSTFLDAAFNFRGAMESIEMYEQMYGDRLHVVKAESISQNPEREARILCKFLQLDYEESMVNADKLHAEGEDWASNTSFGGPYKKIPSETNRWKEHLTRAEIIFVELITQPYLTSLGYTSSGLVPTQEDWDEIASYTSEPFLDKRFQKWLHEGRGSQGYRTDPYTHEMKIVFPERYPEKAQ